MQLNGTSPEWFTVKYHNVICSRYICTTVLLFLLAILKSVIRSTHMIRIQRYARNLSKDNFVVDTFTIHDACNCVAYVHFYWVNISITSNLNCNFIHSISCGLFGTGSIRRAAFWLLRALQCVTIFTSHMLFSLTSDMKTRGQFMQIETTWTTMTTSVTSYCGVEYGPVYSCLRESHPGNKI